MNYFVGKKCSRVCAEFDCVVMPYRVRENLFIGNISDAAEILQNRSTAEITHILSVLSSVSISFFSEWRSGLVIPAKEIKKVYVGGSDGGGDGDGCSGSDGGGSKSALSSEKVLYSLEYAGKDLKLVRMAVPLRDMESEDLLDYLDVCFDFIDRSRKEGSVLVHCFAGVSRRYNLFLYFWFIAFCITWLCSAIQYFTKQEICEHRILSIQSSSWRSIKSFKLVKGTNISKIKEKNWWKIWE